MLNLYQLPDELVACMESLAGPSFAFDDHCTTSLLCTPMVTYDAAARYELNARCPRGATHDETVTVLLDMVTEGAAGVFHDGHGFYFEGREL